VFYFKRIDRIYGKYIDNKDKENTNYNGHDDKDGNNIDDNNNTDNNNDNERTTSNCEVNFIFNYDNTLELSCKTIVDTSNIDELILNRLLIAIGLCSLPWYWMGFGCKRIVVDENIGNHVTDEMLPFWNELYDNVLLEYMYVNKLNWPVPHIEVVRSEHFVIPLVGTIWSNSFEKPRSDYYDSIKKPFLTNHDNNNASNDNLDDNNDDNNDNNKKNNNDNDDDENSKEEVEININPKNICDGIEDNHRILLPLGGVSMASDQDSIEDNRILLPLGGGKDSLVAWYIARTQNKDPVLTYVCDDEDEYNDSWRLKKVVRTIGTNVHLVKHIFKNPLFEQHARSYLKPCGHPWAALVMFDSVLTCARLKIKSVFLGYEKSADFGNGININGNEINHQYDKSSNFLKVFNIYIKNFILYDIKLNSNINHLWELEIMRIFCMEKSLKVFHPLFLSCNEPASTRVQEAQLDNKNSKSSATNYHHHNDDHNNIDNGGCNNDDHNTTTKVELGEDKINHNDCGDNDHKGPNKGRSHSRMNNNNNKKKQICDNWCTKCEKCAFIYLLLSAWLNPIDVSNIFGVNMFEDKNNIETFLRLIGAEGRMKPFECVGTFNEAKAAFHLTLLKYQKNEKK